MFIPCKKKYKTMWWRPSIFPAQISTMMIAEWIINIDTSCLCQKKKLDQFLDSVPMCPLLLVVQGLPLTVTLVSHILSIATVFWSKKGYHFTENQWIKWHSLTVKLMPCPSTATVSGWPSNLIMISDGVRFWGSSPIHNELVSCLQPCTYNVRL